MSQEYSSTFVVTPERSSCLGDPRFVGDPIDVVTGANTDIAVDFRLTGPLNLRWRRYYDSARNTIAGSMGWGHSHDFDRTLTYDLDGLHTTDPFGVDLAFPPLAVGRRAVNSGVLLHRSTETTYALWRAGQPIQDFEFKPFSDVAPLRRLRRNGASIEFHYDPQGRLSAMIDSLQRSIGIEADRLGRIVGLFLADPAAPKGRRALMLYHYDAAGNLFMGQDAYNNVIRFRWDQHNRMTCRTDRRGYSFHFKYDDEGRCIHSRGDDGLLEVTLDYEPDWKTTFVRRGDGGQWIYAYNDNKSLTQITDPEGHATKFVLDEKGRPVQEIDPNGNVTTLHYDWRGGHDYRIDPNGNVLPTKEAEPNPVDPLAYELPATDLEWDFGRLLKAQDIQPRTVDDPLLAQFPAIVANAVLNRSSRYLDATITAPPFQTGRPAENNDACRTPECSASRLAQSWKHDANGNLVEHRDREGSVYRYVYTSWNALTQSVDPLGGATIFNLTVQGLMAKVTDPGGTVTDYSYDLRERLIEVREGGRLVESYRRDPAGNVIEKRDASGRTLVTWEVGSGNLDKVRLLGSGEKHRFEHNPKGRIIQAETPSGVATFAYDDDGNLLADQRDDKGVVHQFEFKRLIATTHFGAFKVAYRSLGNGRVIIQDPTGARHQFQTSKTGLIAKFLANGSRELSEFDAKGRCLRKAVARSAEDAFPWLRRYEYSAAGDVVAINDNKHGTTKYRHDAAHRLIEEAPSSGPARVFEYDRAGNLVRQPGLAGAVMGDCNRLREANGEVFIYNDRYHLAQRQGPSGIIRYEYDDLDMLVRCEIKGEAWTASYDGLSRRVQKTWRGETTTYYWDDFRLAAEVRHDGSCRLYIYADETALAPFLFIDYESVDAAPESGLRYYIFTSQVAAPIRVEDSAGQAVWSARVDPYGKTQVDAGSSIELNLRFPGHYFDRETGLHYNRFRYFSPELGRYLQPDPAGLEGGINGYAYPNKPLTVVDVDGLGRKKGAAPKTKNPPPPSVGCHADLDKGLTPEQVKAELEKKVTQLRLDIEAAKAANKNLKEVIAPDGTVLKVHPSVGPCLSAVYDTKTGKVYYGQNTGKAPTNLREPLQTNANETARENYMKTGMMEGYPEKGPTVTQPYGSLPGKGIPGSHGEVNATDKAMRDRDQQRSKDPSVPPPETKDMVIYNQATTDQTQKKGEGKECCPNCKSILGTEKPGDSRPGENKGPIDVSD